MLCQVPVEVASFLLNEKRTEIAKIELKQRINVLMVPNKTLETPNYKLERLKHDDPRLDHIEASYKMADTIEDPTSVTRRSQEPTNKQTPVIKGVLPDAPAPQAAPRAEAAPKAVVPARPTAAAPSPGRSGFAPPALRISRSLLSAAIFLSVLSSDIGWNLQVTCFEIQFRPEPKSHRRRKELAPRSTCTRQGIGLSPSSFGLEHREPAPELMCRPTGAPIA